MTRHFRLLASTSALCALALPAAADVTADEVLAMFTDLTAATGGTVEATQSRDGDRLKVEDVAVRWAFPFELGEFSLRGGPYTMVEAGDGSVVFEQPKQSTVAFAVRINIEGDEVSATGAIEFTQTDSALVVSGSADDMTLSVTNPKATVALTGFDLTLPPGEDLGFDPGAVVATADVADINQTTRYVREDGVMRISSQSETGVTSYSFSFPFEFGGTSTSTGGNSGTATTMDAVLPRGGADVMNLALAIRDGLSLAMTTEARDVTSVAETTGPASSTQTTRTARQSSSLSFGEEGLQFGGTAEGAEFSFLMPELLPVQLGGSIAEVSARFVVPLLASPEAAMPVEYDIALTGLTLEETIWSLFDPAQFLPRDPADVVIDLGAEVRPLVDLLDINTMIAMIEGEQTPVELDSVRIDALRIAAAGAELQGDGAFTLDFSDMATFPGMPRPEGSAKVRLAGANALLDTLVEMGLMADEDVMGARMGMGMFTRVVSDDLVESEVVVTGEGQVFVNDQRMR